MKKLLFLILASGFWLLASGFCYASAGTTISAVVTVTNAPTGTNGETITINGRTYTWTNAVQDGLYQIASTNNNANSATNLFKRLSVDYTNLMDVKYSSSTAIKFQTYLNGALTISLSTNGPTNWGTLTLTTNTPTTGPIDGASLLDEIGRAHV